MNHIRDMIRSKPQPSIVGRDAVCIDACYDCAQSCRTCAGACLGETENLQKLVRCIRLDQDCADVCTVTGNMLSRGVQPDRDVVELSSLRRRVPRVRGSLSARAG